MKKLQLKPNSCNFRVIKGLVLCFALVMASAIADNAFADRYKSTDNSTPQEVADGMGTKLLRGVANIGTGWVELPKQIYYETKDEGWGKGLTLGPVKGIIMTIVRTGTGVLEVLTFPVPYPDFYGPYFDPPYVWQKE